MIAVLTGNILQKDLKYIVIDVSGVGYKVFCLLATSEKAIIGEKMTFFTHLSVRENALDLYGFTLKEELDFFELLVSFVSGVGPKSALGILNVASPATLRKAITTNDSGYLTKVSGIGKKTAEKIVLELKDKIIGNETENGVSALDESDVIEALKALGYSEKQIRETLKKIKDVSDAGEKIKKALKILSGHEK